MNPVFDWPSLQECSGIGCPLMAMREMGLPFKHLAATEYNQACQVFGLRNFPARTMFGNILSRDPDDLPQADIYVAGFPCKVGLGSVVAAIIPQNKCFASKTID